MPAGRATAGQSPEGRAEALEHHICSLDRPEDWKEVFVQSFLDVIPPSDVIDCLGLLLSGARPEAAQEVMTALINYGLTDQMTRLFQQPSADYLVALLLDAALETQDIKSSVAILSGVASAAWTPARRSQFFAGFTEAFATKEQPDWMGLASVMARITAPQPQSVAAAKHEFARGLRRVIAGEIGWESGRPDAASALVFSLGHQRDPQTLRATLSEMPAAMHREMWNWATRAVRYAQVIASFNGLAAMRPSPIFPANDVALWKLSAFQGIATALYHIPHVQADNFVKSLAPLLPLALAWLVPSRPGSPPPPITDEDIESASLAGFFAHAVLIEGKTADDVAANCAALARLLLGRGGVIEQTFSAQVAQTNRQVFAERLGFLLGLLVKAARQAGARSTGPRNLAARFGSTIGWLFSPEHLQEASMLARALPPSAPLAKAIELAFVEGLVTGRGPEQAIRILIDDVFQKRLGMFLNIGASGPVSGQSWMFYVNQGLAAGMRQPPQPAKSSVPEN